MIFGRKKTFVSSGSLSQLAWIRFRKNKLGMASLTLIILSFILGLMGYLITPDSTPFANRQILEISTQHPGFSVDMLMVRKNEPAKHANMFQKMLFGITSNYHEIPIDTFWFDNETLNIRIFDPDEHGFIEQYNLADIVYPVSGEVESEAGKINFRLVTGETKNESLTTLKSMVENSNIVSNKYWLGTDQFGRDLLSRLIIGTRVSLSVGFISVAISLIVGILLGSLSGYYGGRTDDVIMWFINVVWSIPTLLMVIAITFALGRGFWQIFVAVGLTMWVEVARVVRGQIMSLREKEFVEAGFALGFSNFRIITRHILPNILSPVIVISAANFAAAILIEAGLSFLGIGVQPPIPSWGNMIKEYYSFIILDAAYLAIIPGLAIIILVVAFMTLGNVLRDALDVKIETA